ncbi:MAG: hypothetical protein U0797_03835 [Gemmataceae bacterium]
MFKLYSGSLFALLLLTGLARAQGKPSPRQVIDDYLKAIGGKDELERVKSLRTRGTMTFRVAGQRATFEYCRCGRTRRCWSPTWPGWRRSARGSTARSAGRSTRSPGRR